MVHKRKELSKMKARTIVLLLLALLFIVAACSPTSNAPVEGEKSFTFEVTDADGNVSSQTIRTTETTVGAALINEGLIDGDVSDFGLMVTHVNGIRADFVEDEAWWAFYIDGEMAMAGVDATDVEEGVTYAFVYTPA